MSLKGLVTVTLSPLTERICRLWLVPSSPLMTRVSPALAVMARSRVMTVLVLLIASTRPPVSRPANSSSLISITLAGAGISPSSPTLNVTILVSSCSDFNAHNPALWACPLLVQPHACMSATRTPNLAMAFSSLTYSYSVLKWLAGLSHATLATVWRSLARVPVYSNTPSMTLARLNE